MICDEKKGWNFFSEVTHSPKCSHDASRDMCVVVICQLSQSEVCNLEMLQGDYMFDDEKLSFHLEVFSRLEVLGT